MHLSQRPFVVSLSVERLSGLISRKGNAKSCPPVNKTMRQGQHHRRRGSHGPKPQNASVRHYESNGPDVKLRGTAEQLAQKYLSLARDALVSGDMVAAESYFQHAEHYNRIIMAAQSQMGVPNSSAGHNGDGGFHPRWNADVSDKPNEI